MIWYGMMLTGENQSSQRKKPVVVPLCPPQIPNKFTENVAGSLPEECTMNSVSGVSERMKIIILLVLMHAVHQLHKTDMQ
jgi:hypothetical protein